MMSATIQGTQPITLCLFSQTKQEAGRLWNPCSIRTPCHFPHRPPTPSRGIFYWASEIPRVINMHTWERRKMSRTQMQSIRSLWAARKDIPHTLTSVTWWSQRSERSLIQITPLHEIHTGPKTRSAVAFPTRSCQPHAIPCQNFKSHPSPKILMRCNEPVSVDQERKDLTAMPGSIGGMAFWILGVYLPHASLGTEE